MRIYKAKTVTKTRRIKEGYIKDYDLRMCAYIMCNNITFIFTTTGRLFVLKSDKAFYEDIFNSFKKDYDIEFKFSEKESNTSNHYNAFITSKKHFDRLVTNFKIQGIYEGECYAY